MAGSEWDLPCFLYFFIIFASVRKNIYFTDMKKLTLVMAIIAAFSFTAKAQVFDPYFYLQLQGGASFDHGDVQFTKLISPAAQVALGYQMNDAWAVRLAATGWQAKNTAPSSATIYGFKFVQPMVDLVLDLGTAFAGWNPDRVFNPYIYVGAGSAIGLENQDAINLSATEAFSRLWEPTKFMWATRSGLGADIRLTDRLALNLEFNGNIYSESFDSKLNNPYDDGGDYRFNAFAGLKFNFGKVTRKVKPAPVAPAATYTRPEPAQPKKEVTQEPSKPTYQPQPAAQPIELGADVDIFFDLNKSVIRDDQVNTLNRLVSFMRNTPDAKVKLDGYADKQTGTADINQELSEQRVIAVRQYLVSRGIDPARITTAAHGDKVQPFTGEKNRAVTCRIR